MTNLPQRVVLHCLHEALKYILPIPGRLLKLFEAARAAVVPRFLESLHVLDLRALLFLV